MFVNGSTAIDGLSGRGSGFDGPVRCVEPAAGNAGSRDTEHVHRLFDILDSLRSKIIEAEGKRPACIRVGLCGDIHRSRLREALQPRGDVHPVAQQVAIPHHHVANVNPDPELQAVLRRVCPDLSEASASCTWTAHRTASTALGNSARTLSPAVFAIRPPCSAISRSMISRRSVRLRSVRILILAHQARVTRHVSCEDSCQSPLDLVLLWTHRTPGAVPDQLCCRSGRVSSLHLGSARSCRQAWPNVSGRRG